MGQKNKGILDQIEGPDVSTYKKITKEDLSELIDGMFKRKTESDFKITTGVSFALALTDQEFISMYPFHGVQFLSNEEGYDKIQARIKELIE